MGTHVTEPSHNDIRSALSEHSPKQQMTPEGVCVLSAIDRAIEDASSIADEADRRRVLHYAHAKLAGLIGEG